MTNRPASEVERRAKRSGLAIDFLSCNERKGSGKLVGAFCDSLKCEPHEMLTVGEDKFGFIEAINGRSFCFHAEWSSSLSEYGIHLAAPSELLEYLDIFFMKSALWYATLDARDSLKRTVTFRALIDGDGAGSAKTKQALIETLKEKRDQKLAGASLSRFMMMHMIVSAYLDGLLSIDRYQALWQIYPGHSPDSTPPPVILATIQGFKLFRSKTANRAYYGLQRLAEAPKSSAARFKNERHLVRFTNQMNTIAIAPATAVASKRVLVVDDFSTEGYSLEAARNMYLSAGAKSVVLLAFGKYGSRYDLQVPIKSGLVKPKRLTNYATTDFESETRSVTLKPPALDDFLSSLQRLKGSPIAEKLLT